MERAFIIIGEIVLWIIIIIIARTILGMIIPNPGESEVINLIMYMMSGFGGAVIYRLNAKNKE